MSARTATCREAPGPRGTNAARAPTRFLHFMGHGHRLPSPSPRAAGRGPGRGVRQSPQTNYRPFQMDHGHRHVHPLHRSPRTPISCTPDGSATGIFRAVWQLAVDYRFEDWAFAVLDDDLDWFQEHLPVPNNVRGGRALCWFRPEAREVISRAWQMAKLVESAGIPVRVYRKVLARNGRLRGRLPGRSSAMARHIWLIEPPEDFDNPIAVLIWRS